MTILLGRQGSAAGFDFSQLPSKPGVYCLQDEEHRTLLLAATANLRRAVAAKLDPNTDHPASRRQLRLHDVVHHGRIATVGSAFEADWAYLQWARFLLPQSYRGLLDRWQAWFIHCDPTAEHPQLVKTAHPQVNQPGVHLGPFPDKHAAGRYMELLQDAFDLCRYHHILVQSPHARACAYKEMGRCPAPCDGTVTLDSFRQQYQQAIEFAMTSLVEWRRKIEMQMEASSQALEFEQAQRFRNLLERTEPAAKRDYAQVNRIERFEFIALMPSEKAGRGRAFLIRRGWVAPIFDFNAQVSADSLADSLAQHISSSTSCAQFTPAALENIGMVCWHLFRPRKTSRGSFLRFQTAPEFRVEIRDLQQALRKLQMQLPPDQEDIADHDLDDSSNV
jgi:excinuclease UvrABC nuclease subunit